MSESERHFAPNARYAASNNPGIRWFDPETEQEHFSRPIGVNDLLDAGASLNNPDGIKLVSRVEINPYQPPSERWQVEVVKTRLDVRKKNGHVDFVTTQSFVKTEVFDDRDDAVVWAEEGVEAFRTAEQQDAIEWREARRQGDAA